MMREGRPYLKRAMALGDGGGYLLAVRAFYAAKQGDDTADGLFLDALELALNDVDAMNVYASYLREQRRNEEALAIIERALELDPLSVHLYHELGRTHLFTGRFEAAQRAFDRIAEINPENPYAAHGSAMATIMSGALVRAGGYSDAAGRMDPDDYENPATAVFVYGSIDDWPAAKVRMEAALSLGPDATIAFYDQDYKRGAANFPLGIAKVEAMALLGRVDAALAELQRLLEDGWRMRWRWDTLMNRNLESLHGDPRLVRITDQIAADIERQKREFSDRSN